MNPIAAAVQAALATSGVAALSALAVPARARAAAVGTLVAVTGMAGAAAGVLAATGTGWRLHVPALLPLSGMSLAVDALSGWFLLLVGAVVAVAGVYTIGYAHHGGSGSRPALVVLPLFCLAMLVVPLADSVSSLLLSWELMAVTSLLLVAADHRRQPAVTAATVWYAAMTQAGFVAVLLGLCWLAAACGGESFASVRAATLSEPLRSGVFLLCLAGFASKAGAVPLHPWLPRAHTEAPAHVSILMSAAMVKLGVYGLLRVGFDLLGGGPRWWWLLVGALGALSALHGILQTVVTTDLKRMLAYSTSENVGLILLGTGLAGLLADAGRPPAAALALAAALLHALNHAGFKTVLFAGAGAVLRATGTRDLDRLGGLSRRMPATVALLSVAALCAAALPPGNGFVSEWLLLQALVHQSDSGGRMLAVAAPVAVAIVALTAGVGVAAYVKLIGTGLLARPRGDGAAAAREAPPSMLVAMVLAAGGCAALALVPAIFAPALRRIATALRLGDAPLAADPIRLRLAGVGTTVTPLWIAAGVVGLTLLVAGFARLAGQARRRAAAAWDCGAGPLTARMEYTATSFAEPLQRVFDNVVQPVRDVDVTHHVESQYYIAAIRYRQQIPDPVENRLYRPVIAVADRVGRAARRLATGSVHHYLAYLFIALVAVLLAGVTW